MDSKIIIPVPHEFLVSFVSEAESRKFDKMDLSELHEAALHFIYNGYKKVEDWQVFELMDYINSCYDNSPKEFADILSGLLSCNIYSAINTQFYNLDLKDYCLAYSFEVIDSKAFSNDGIAEQYTDFVSKNAADLISIGFSLKRTPRFIIDQLNHHLIEETAITAGIRDSFNLEENIKWLCLE